VNHPRDANGGAGTAPDRWDEEFDVVVVGFGGAGACAAIQAADEGARVLVLERFAGGGATRRSGGVIYAGGGTAPQRSAGFQDDPEKMLDYLRREAGDAVDEATLRAFCERSLENIRWLESNGVAFPEKFFPQKTTQPPSGYGLYFSGNEKQLSRRWPPIPRGHVPGGAGMTGGVLYEALRKAALARKIDVRRRSRPVRLIVDGGGAVTGLEVLTLSGAAPVRTLHALLHGLCFVFHSCFSILEGLERAAGRITRVRARGGVVICAGGFVFNPKMLAGHARPYARCMPIGTPGDDGSGIRLGQSAGGAVGAMDACAASRFICPPEAFVSGILVGASGERFCDESLYGATLSRHIALQPGGFAYLIIDSKHLGRARGQMKREERLLGRSLGEIFSGRMNALIFRKATAFINMRINRKKSRSLEKLEAKLGMPSGSLVRSVAENNAAIGRGEEDRFGKAREFLDPIAEPPFYAVDCSLASRLFPGPCFTLGGLRVDGLSAQVLRVDGSPIPGLYAAGRSAAGVCSSSYVSGLSLADCVFSGRNAGKSAAAAGRCNAGP
jgi:3-oxo-5alpha-steroid 4-dehydrogenase